MTRERVEEILRAEGWYTLNRQAPMQPGNNSIYIEWYKDVVCAFVGNWFIETEVHMHAYPYKDKLSTEEELIEFIQI